MITIVDEYGNKVPDQFLKNVLTISKSAQEFLQNVNYGITEANKEVSPDNNLAILKFYNSNKPKN